MIPFEEIECRWDIGNELMHILPILEYEFETATSYSNNSETIKNETLILVVNFALGFKSDYWYQLALNWVESGAQINNTTYKALTSLSTDKTTSQSIRHSAFKFAKRWERKNGI